MTDDVREVVEDHEMEIAPDQIAEPGVGFLFASGADQLANADRAEAQMHREMGTALHGREVAHGPITPDAFLAEFVPEDPGARHAGLDAEFAQVATEPDASFFFFHGWFVPRRRLEFPA